MSFADRHDAGERLAEALLGYRERNPIVLGLPRGGVSVAREIARALNAPLDVWVVRKVGLPWRPELGLGAVAEGDVVVLDRQLMARMGISAEEVDAIVRDEQQEVFARVQRFRGTRGPPALADRTVILVDDGIATGGTMRAAIQSIRMKRPGRIVVAVPVADPEILDALAPLVEEIVCLAQEPDLDAVGVWYRDFTQVSDREVVDMVSSG
jgi:putative phosphoribosyl transferase